MCRTSTLSPRAAFRAIHAVWKCCGVSQKCAGLVITDIAVVIWWRVGLAPRSVRAITADEVAEINKTQYWDAVRGDELQSGVDYAVYDYAVNSGPKRAIMDLQRVIGAKVDGITGMETVGKTNAMDPFAVIEGLCNARIAFMKVAKNRKTGRRLWPTFGKGWSARVMGVKDGFQADDIGVIDRAIVLARGESGESLPSPVAVGSGKAVEVERDSITQSSTMKAVLTQMSVYAGGAWAAFQELDGQNQTIALIVIGALALTTVWIGRERIRHWIEGVK